MGGSFMSESAGRVLMIPKGTYSPTTTYDPLDAVKYEHNSYVCKQTSRGNLPTNTTYWQPLTDVTADENPTEDSTNLVQSGGVYSALRTINQTLTNNVSGIYDVIGKTGSKNWLKLTDVITGADITTITDEGANINVKKATAASWARFAVKIDVQPNTDYIMSTHIDYVSGRARVAVRNADDSANIFESADIQSDSDFSRQFNTGANSQVVVRLFCTANTVETGEVNFENAMIRLATDVDATFQPYAKTNKELTDELTSSLNTYYKDGISWNYGLFLEWASPSFNSVTTQLGNMTILDIFNAMPIEANGVSHAHGSSIKIGTYDGNRPLFNDIVSWFNLSSIGAGVLEIIKFEASRGLVRYTKQNSAEIYEGWIMSSAKSRRYKYSGTEIT
jgi:hypothetical protein